MCTYLYKLSSAIQIYSILYDLQIQGFLEYLHTTVLTFEELSNVCQCKSLSLGNANQLRSSWRQDGFSVFGVKAQLAAFLHCCLVRGRLPVPLTYNYLRIWLFFPSPHLPTLSSINHQPQLTISFLGLKCVRTIRKWRTTETLKNPKEKRANAIIFEASIQCDSYFPKLSASQAPTILFSLCLFLKVLTSFYMEDSMQYSNKTVSLLSPTWDRWIDHVCRLYSERLNEKRRQCSKRESIF